MRFFLKLEDGDAIGWAAGEITEQEKLLTPKFISENYLLPAFKVAKKAMEKASLREKQEQI